LGPFWLPKCLLFGTLLALKIDQKIDPKSDWLKGRSKNAPRAPKTLPRRPPDLPGEPQDPLRRLPDPLRTPLDGPKGFSETPGPRHFFGKFQKINLSFFRRSSLYSGRRKNRKIRNRRKKVEKKSRRRSSTVVTRIGLHKNRKSFHNGRTQRVAAVVARSALQ
jgi:hypothetical protein